MSLPADRGLIVCNPPYGERMLEQRSAQRLYGAFGRHLKYADGWKKYIISSEPEFEHYYGKQAVKKAQTLQRALAVQRVHVLLITACTHKTNRTGESSAMKHIFYCQSRGREVRPDGGIPGKRSTRRSRRAG